MKLPYEKPIVFRVDEIQVLKGEGMSIDEMAQHFRCSNSVIEALLNSEQAKVKKWGASRYGKHVELPLPNSGHQESARKTSRLLSGTNT